jgi:hypothetical protein
MGVENFNKDNISMQKLKGDYMRFWAWLFTFGVSLMSYILKTCD